MIIKTICIFEEIHDATLNINTHIYAFFRGNQQLCALQAVQQFGTRLAELQSALQRDKDTLAILDVALEAGATSEVASSVRHVARLLSEKQDTNQVPFL